MTYDDPSDEERAWLEAAAQALGARAVRASFMDMCGMPARPDDEIVLVVPAGVLADWYVAVLRGAGIEVHERDDLAAGVGGYVANLGALRRQLWPGASRLASQ